MKAKRWMRLVNGSAAQAAQEAKKEAGDAEGLMRKAQEALMEAKLQAMQAQVAASPGPLTPYGAQQLQQAQNVSPYYQGYASGTGTTNTLGQITLSNPTSTGWVMPPPQAVLTLDLATLLANVDVEDVEPDPADANGLVLRCRVGGAQVGIQMMLRMPRSVAEKALGFCMLQAMR